MARVRAVHGAIAATVSGRLDRQGLAAALREADGLPTAPLWLFMCACATGAVALALIFGAHRPEAIACIARGGTDRPANPQALCRDCNLRKGDR